MSIQAILLIIAIFLCILVLPVVFVLRSPEDTGETPKKEEERVRADERYPAVRDSEEVAEMAALVRSVPDMMTASLQKDGFRLMRKIDRLGETEKIEGKEILFEQPMSEEQMLLVRYALEEVLAPEYLTAPRYIGKRKERRVEGHYVFLDPNITGKLVDERTKEAIYNGERTGDL